MPWEFSNLTVSRHFLLSNVTFYTTFYNFPLDIIVPYPFQKLHEELLAPLHLNPTMASSEDDACDVCGSVSFSPPPVFFIQFFPIFRVTQLMIRLSTVITAMPVSICPVTVWKTILPGAGAVSAVFSPEVGSHFLL